MRLITVCGGNLFRIAALELGDAARWVIIAKANHLSDPVLTGIVTLLIPESGSYVSDNFIRQLCP